MRSTCIATLLALLLPAAHASDTLKPGYWEARLSFSADGKQWTPMGAARGECLLPDQASKVKSTIRRHLMLYGCRLDRLELTGAKGSGAAGCWPQGKGADFGFSVGVSADRYELQLDTKAVAPEAPRQLGRQLASRTRDCDEKETKIAKTRAALEAEDGSGGAY